MDFSKLIGDITFSDIINLLDQYAELGPIPGILLPMLEAFLPILPVVVFVMANAAAFGFWKGSLISWIGSCIGSIIVFLIFRKLSQKRLGKFIQRHEKVRKLMNWIEKHGFGPIFLLLCFPFSPSALINIVAGISRVSIYQFILAVLLGKMIMIFVISYIGYDITALIYNPIKTVVAVVVIIVLWFVGKKLEIYLQTRAAKDKENQTE